MRVGVIGVGKMGISHLAIANQTNGIELVAICDSSKTLINALCKNTTFLGYTDHKKMIAKESLDAVLICVPNSYHFQMAKECLDKNIHVFIEKPLTLEYSESLELADLAEKKNLVGMVGYINRFNPIFAQLKHLLSHGVLGKVISYESKMLGGVVLEEQSKGWRNDYKKGGGCLSDYGPHCIDLAIFLFGEDVIVKNAILQKVHSTAVDDMVFAVLDHESGPVGNILVNWSDPTMRKASNHIEVVGSHGKLIANKQEIKLFSNQDYPEVGLKKGWNEIYVTDLNTEVNYFLRGEDFSRQMQNFSNCLNSAEIKPVSSLRSGAVVDKVISDIFKVSGGLR